MSPGLMRGDTGGTFALLECRIFGFYLTGDSNNKSEGAGRGKSIINESAEGRARFSVSQSVQL